jgi:hypothetical protein
MEPRLRLELRTPYRFFWLKYLPPRSAFDPAQHCAACLLGPWSSVIRWNKPSTRKPAGFRLECGLDEYPAESHPYLYLCGVAESWAHKFHCLMQRDPAESFTHSDPRIELAVEGMRRLTIQPAPPGVRHLPRGFWTCRCWQAGLTLWPEAIAQIPPPAPPTPSPPAAAGES